MSPPREKPSCYNISMPKKNSNHTRLNKSSHLKYKICVSGAAETGLCSKDALLFSERVGAAVAKAGMVLVTGSTIGIPQWAAKGAKEAGGIVIGFSPASSEIAHIKTYHLPTDYHDIIVYTGFEYAGRNLMLTRAADAIITICGRIGTLNEFTIAFEDQKINGILEGSGGAADMLRDILTKSKRGFGKTTFSKNPEELVAKVIDMIRHEETHVHNLHNHYRRNYQTNEFNV